jgi:hypothetical protein
MIAFFSLERRFFGLFCVLGVLNLILEKNPAFHPALAIILLNLI